MSLSQKLKGFTLFEMLLVLVIITSILLLMTGYLTTKIDESRRDRAVMQIEQILNAGLAYYVNFAKWPGTVSELQTAGYLPNKGTINNPWGREYALSSDLTKGTFSVCSAVLGSTRTTSPGGSGTPPPSTPVSTAVIESGIIAGRLPMAYATGDTFTGTNCPTPPSGIPTQCTADECTVVSTVNIPGQNLNNARSVNFAGLYHNGACVPVPSCPLNMEPAIMVAPVSVSGNFEGTSDVYPLNSFTAFATPKGKSASMQICTSVASPPAKFTPCDFSDPESVKNPSDDYWRVCLDVVTEKGKISIDKNDKWKETSGSIMAITRCAPKTTGSGTGEPIGSGFKVFENR